MMQLDEPIAVETPLGLGHVMFIESGNDETWWTVVLDESRAFVTFRQHQVRARPSYSEGRGGVSHKQMRKIIKPRDGSRP